MTTGRGKESGVEGDAQAGPPAHHLRMRCPPWGRKRGLLSALLSAPYTHVEKEVTIRGLENAGESGRNDGTLAK